MMAHELLRQAALILAAGWSKGTNARDSAGSILAAGHSKGTDARDSAGSIVPLWKGGGAARVTVNPEAQFLSPYGA
jgi:hypothetical protein